MYPEVTLTMIDGTKVVVPDSLELITPYVLREQQDWFEDEIVFLRRLLRPGQKIIDIGANYGLYTLSMARTVGSSGSVWAFEPSSSTAACLQKSIRANAFDHVLLECSALSNREGNAEFSMKPHAEMNSLVATVAPGEPTESVPLLTLDGFVRKLGDARIDFVKIDAEGEEVNILQGGQQFFARQSPLVQYEVIEGKDVHLDIMQAFAAMGYDSYRLVPALDLLVPVMAGQRIDRYQLNLFACKQDCAAELAEAGWLLERLPTLDPVGDLPDEVTADQLNANDCDWRTTLARLPYGQKLASGWETGVLDEETGPLEEALALFLISRNEQCDKATRFTALYCGFRRLQKLVEASPAPPRQATLARLAHAFGEREYAVQTLAQLIEGVTRNRRLDLGEPFLAPAERFDAIDPGDALQDWFMIAAIEELERLSTFSSIYTGEGSLPRLEHLCASRFAGEQMKRRLALVRQRFSAAAASAR